MSAPSVPRPRPRCLPTGAALFLLVALAGCSRQDGKPTLPAMVDVATVTVAPADVPVTATYVAQTQSSQMVNIQARVSGFLDKRVYTEGSTVKAGQVLFRMDPKPFQAQVDGAAAALQRQQAAYNVAKANLDRTKPLVEKNALSKKDLDDAQGQYEQAGAAVEQAKAQLEQAKLDLSYTTITSPVNGVSSYAQVADGTYVNAQNSQLTTVSVLSPMWVNFSISENQMQRLRDDVQKGRLKLPPGGQFLVEIVLTDGSLYPHAGRITFADPSYNAQTGTFLLRATVDNPQGWLRPNQYVRTLVKGAVRPNAVVLPQRAVQQGAKGHFVWVVNREGKAELRPVVVGDWKDEGWLIEEGLAAGDQVVVDGVLRLAGGTPVKATPYAAPPAPQPQAARPAPAAASGGLVTSVRFASGNATLDAAATKTIRDAAATLAQGALVLAITGYADRSGDPAANVELAKARAKAVRDALVAAGVPAERVRLSPPSAVTGTGTDAQARRVDIAVAL
jgi:membrane fusion protein (multidrug efflux system)